MPLVLEVRVHLVCEMEPFSKHSDSILLFIKYKYVLRAVGCFPGPYLANSFNRSTHKAKPYRAPLFRGGG